MSNKEVLELMIMGKKITIACPPKDKEGLIKAAEILSLLSKTEEKSIKDLASKIEKSLN